MADVQTSVVRQPPYIEKRTEQLLASVFGDPNATKKKKMVVKLLLVRLLEI